MSPARAGMHRLWLGPCAAFPLMAPLAQMGKIMRNGHCQAMRRWSGYLLD